MRAKDVFLDAIELHGTERAAYLDRTCANDPGLRERVEELLVAVAEALSARR